MEFARLISHRQTLTNVHVVCGLTPLPDALDNVLAALSSPCSVTVALYGLVKEGQLSEAVRASVRVREPKAVSDL